MTLGNAYFTYENPNNGRTTRIYYDMIEEVAQEAGDYRSAISMDDDSFYRYAEEVASKTWE